MFGYIIVNKPELKFREYDKYRSYYCGLCNVLKNRYGRAGQMCISYDMTFLIILLTGLYEPETDYYEERCIAHPIIKHEVRKNVLTEYVADMNIILCYYKCLDDWVDEKKMTRKVEAAALKNKVNIIINKYPDKAEYIKYCLDELAKAEERNETNIDTVSRHFGNLMAEVMAIYDDEWKAVLKRIGFCLGKYIYIVDAYEDMDQDRKANRYNILNNMDDIYNDPLLMSNYCENLLNTIMAECAAGFELLPIIDDVEILRNIIYSGVWIRFNIVKNKRINTGNEKIGEKKSD